jgi:cytochrome P450
MQTYDPYDPATIDNPYPIYEELRKAKPVFRDPAGRFWALSRFADVHAAARDHLSYSSARDGVDLDQLGQFIGIGNFLDADPPEHDELRRLVQPYFTPRALREHEAFVQKRVAELLNPILEDGEGDLLGDFSHKLSVDVISHILGVPQSDREEVSLWVRSSSHLQPGETEISQVGRETITRVREYFTALAREIRRTGSGKGVSKAIVPSDFNGQPVRPEVFAGCASSCLRPAARQCQTSSQTRSS